jgi:ribosomal protein S18 acetylase RimI-like enzyme
MNAPLSRQKPKRAFFNPDFHCYASVYFSATRWWAWVAMHPAPRRTHIKIQNQQTMTSTRPFQMNDLLRFNNVNLDVLTETYNMPFYLQYMSTGPELFTVAEAPDGSITGYMLGKAEGAEELWHGHVSAVTVAPSYRRLGLARMLMEDLESTSSNVYNAYFVDLFVRASNA